MNKYEKQVEQLQLNKEKQVFKDLKTMYRKALDGVNEMIVMLMSDPTSKSKAYQAKFQAVLKRQIETLLDVLQNKEFDTINEFLKESYDNGYIGTMYVIKEQGIPLMLPISQEQVIKAIQLDSKISKGLYEKLGEDVKELKKKIRSEVSRGISTSMNYTDISRNINNVSNVGINNAMRIARTESHRIKSAASYDAALKAKKKGADIVLQWDATLDGKTRKRHKQLDGEIRELGETFSNGLRYPGDENGSAAEVINCRCVALTRARWGLDEEELKELERRAEYFELDKTKDFEEYKRKYLKANDEFDLKKQFKKYSEDKLNLQKRIEEAEKKKKEYEHDGILNDNADAFENARKMSKLLNDINKQLQSVEEHLEEIKKELSFDFESATIDLKKYSDFSTKDLEALKETASNITEKERKAIYSGSSGYIKTSNSFGINKYLRTGDKSALRNFDKSANTIKELENVIKKNYCSKDGIVYRFVDADFLDHYGLSTDFDAINEYDAIAKKELLNEFNVFHSGSIDEFKAFTSASYDAAKNVFTNRPVKLTIHVPKGSNMYLTDNVKESEVIFNKDSKFKIYGAKWEGRIFNIFMELIK